jgi:hypothetical protein
VAIIAAFTGLVAFDTTAAQPRAVASGSEGRHIVDGPALESATATTAIVRWTANTRRGTATHYGIVRYGTKGEHLDHTARSPTRWNQSLPGVVYRVRLDGLTPGTTYYFTVDAAQADGIGLGLKSPVRQFTTPPRR